MPKFEIIKGGAEDASEENKKELRQQLKKLAEDHSTHIGLHPKWCVWGRDPDGGAGILYWIKPGKQDEFIARQMSQILNKLGGEARAEMTEWNEMLTEKPIHKRKGSLNYIINNK